jgi:hypothetical protein
VSADRLPVQVALGLTKQRVTQTNGRFVRRRPRASRRERRLCEPRLVEHRDELRTTAMLLTQRSDVLQELVGQLGGVGGA